MKKLTKFATLIIMGSLIIFGSSSCKKYDDNTAISLTTRTARVSNTWKVDNYKVNDADYTSLVADYYETFTKGGDYSYTWGALSGTGTWAFENNEANVRITGIENQTSQSLVILKLEEKAFWYYIIDGNDKKEYHMIQK